MEINRLYDLAQNEHIDVIDYKFNNINGLYVEDYKTIGLNCSNSNIENKVTLAHELGHYYYDATYFINADSNTINKAEYKARKWSINVLVPYEDLISAIKKGNTTNYTLADYFDVTEDFIKQCVNYYKNKNML